MAIPGITAPPTAPNTGDPSTFSARADAFYAWLYNFIESEWPNLDAAAYLNVVGTVSMSGGAPTGAVLERGSNANGEYVRFADGTQICTATKPASGAGVSTWVFAASFSRPPNMAGGAQSASPRFVTFESKSTISVGYSCWTEGGARSGVSCGLVAVGRWA